jgi:adenosylcobinamide-phosphate synthase
MAGATLDRLLGEPKRWHPLVGFGWLAGRIESRLNIGSGSRLLGLLAWSLAVLPAVVLAGWLCTLPLGWLLHPLLLCFALGGRALEEHGMRVADDLAAGNLAAAREHVGWMVSRDTSALDETGVAKAAVESLLENGNDAVFGALFWFFLLGGAGRAALPPGQYARRDVGLPQRAFPVLWCGRRAAGRRAQLLPARLTALSYALFGNTRRALACWRTQAPQWDSPNAGPVMAAGAGSLQVALGGPAVYHGHLEVRPVLGEGRAPQASDIQRALTLVRHGVRLWLVTAFVVGALIALAAGMAHA